MRASNGAPLDHLLTQEQVTLLTPYGTERRLDVGELLFDERATVDSLYVVLDGRICISRLEGAQEREIGTHLPGEFTGGIAVLTGKRSVHRARAAAPTRVLEIDSSASPARATGRCQRLPRSSSRASRAGCARLRELSASWRRWRH